jgi:hypothetical protein
VGRIIAETFLSLQCRWSVIPVSKKLNSYILGYSDDRISCLSFKLICIKWKYIVTSYGDYRRVLDWWSDLFDALIQHMTTRYNSLLYTQTQHTHKHTLMSIVTSSLAVARWRLPTAEVPLRLCSRTAPASASRFSQQQLITTELQQSCNSLSHSLTNSLHSTDWLTDWLTVLHITSRHGPNRKHRSLLLFPIVAVERSLFANLRVVAQQRFCMPQYKECTGIERVTMKWGSYCFSEERSVSFLWDVKSD